MFQQIRDFSKQLKSENMRIKMEMEVARSIQTALLPKDIANVHPDFEIAASILPADEVGGDYYEIVLDAQKTLWLGIGDVSGYGLKAGLIMMLAQTVHITLLTSCTTSPSEALSIINRVLVKSVRGRMQEEHYMTCTLLKYEGHGSFQYAGMHLDLLIYRQSTGRCEQFETDGIWLNIIDDITLVCIRRIQ